jgi:acyl transferase domain-containing protein
MDSIGSIAIIGMSARFPGAKNPTEFWHNLRDGVESIRFFSDSELEAAGVPPTTLRQPNYVRAKARLDDADLFDAALFGINPREAELMDPQHRVFLECCWEALEDAGYDPDSYSGAIGVYAGASLNTYLFNICSQSELVRIVGGFQIAIGNDKDFIPTRAAYKLNLHGPALNIQTACSTSLVAVHIAYQSLLCHQCDIALAGGVSITMPLEAGYLYQEGGIASPDGHCRAFDWRAQGTVGGNGAGVVVLKRLSEALADGDQIYAVIRGSAINNDGAAKIGYTAPSVDGQAAVIREALGMAGLEAEDISYVEAHGTATPLGDPIEIAALSKAFQASTKRKRYCAIGSVKTNIGHLDAAAGVAGLIKTVLALQHREIPASLHFEQPNPKIDFADSPFYVNTELRPWELERGLRRAGVSSFGIGGTNAHLIVEEAPPPPQRGPSREWQLLVLSAGTGTALERQTVRLSEHLDQHPELHLADVAYTLQVGRRRLEHRRMLICRDLTEAVTILAEGDTRRIFTAHEERRDRSVVFMFPGAGSQHVNMGRELYEREPFFRHQVDHCSELLASRLGFDLRHVLYPASQTGEGAGSGYDDQEKGQVALFVVEYALARLLMHYGVHPKAMLGHSFGEYAAACISGVLTLEDTLIVVTDRSRLVQSLPQGAMLAVAIAEEEAQRHITPEVSLAAVNGPSLCVFSGAVPIIEDLERKLIGSRIVCCRLPVSRAFHSSLIESILEQFAETIHCVSLKRPKIPYISSLTGTWIRPEEATSPKYWIRQFRETVRFADGLDKLTIDKASIFLEVGPGTTLRDLARKHPGARKQAALLTSLPRADQTDSIRYMLETLGRLWLSGVQLNWANFHGESKPQRISLPSYPFERQRFWVSTPNAGPHISARARRDLKEWCYTPVWKQSAPLHEPSHLEESLYIIFQDECGVGTELVALLRERNHLAITVSPGRQFKKTSENAYIIDPHRKSDYDRLAAELASLSHLSRHIVHCWSIVGVGSISDGSAVEEAHFRGTYSVLFCLQAFVPCNIGQLQFAIVSSGLQDVTDSEMLDPLKSPVLGLAAVIPQEYEGVHCRSIDVLPQRVGTPEARTLAMNLLSELTADPAQRVVAYRGARRWVQAFDLLRGNNKPDLIRQDGIYLVTGGLGKIGLAIAERLSALGARVVLTTRQKVDTDGRGRLVTKGQIEALAAKCRQLASLESGGAKVLALQADVGSTLEMEALIHRIRRQCGEIRGVIHAAGVPANEIICPIQDLDPAEFQRHFWPKLHGTLVLEEILSSCKLDFCLLFSSLSTVLGGPGYGAYASANAFMDVFARAHNHSHRDIWMSIGWDGWRFSAGARDDSRPEGMNPHEGLAVLEHLMAGAGVDRVLVSTVDIEQRARLAFAPKRISPAMPSAGRGLSTNLRARSTDAEYPLNPIELEVLKIWTDLIGIDEVGVNDDFFSAGGHSLLAIQLLNQLRSVFHLELSIREVLETPTIAGIARAILRKQMEDIDSGALTEILAEVATVADSRQQEPD